MLLFNNDASKMHCFAETRMLLYPFFSFFILSLYAAKAEMLLLCLHITGLCPILFAS